MGDNIGGYAPDLVVHKPIKRVRTRFSQMLHEALLGPKEPEEIVVSESESESESGSGHGPGSSSKHGSRRGSIVSQAKSVIHAIDAKPVEQITGEDLD